jgi:hypothetical protein
MNLDKKVIFSDTVYTQEIDGEMVLLDMVSENYFGLDGIDSEIWQLLYEGETIRQVQDTLLELYDAEPEVLKNDFQKFMIKLLGSGLVRIE